MDWAEACHLLGVQETASPEEIKAQYVYKANILHPDKTLHLSDAMRAKAEQELKQINHAHDFLTTPGNNPFRNPPKLDIKPKHILFNNVEVGKTKNTTFEIRSIGGPYTNIWVDNQLPEWLSLVSIESTTNEQLPIQVTVQANGIGEPDTKFSYDLMVRLENEKTKLKNEEKVKIELRMKAEPALLTANPNEFENEEIKTGEIETRIFKLANSGRGHLKGKITTYKPWLSVEPRIINIPPYGQQEYIVTINASSLTDGFAANDFIQLNSNAGNYSIPINISVIDSSIEQISVTPTSNSSSKEFWRTLEGFVAVPIGLFWITVPLGLWLYTSSTTGFWSVLATYAFVALVVAAWRGDSKGKEEAIKYRQHDPAATGTKHRDIFAQSTHITNSNLVIGNTFRGTYHRQSCEWVKRISRGNSVKVTRDEARRRGYKPCAVCRP